MADRGRRAEDLRARPERTAPARHHGFAAIRVSRLEVARAAAAFAAVAGIARIASFQKPLERDTGTYLYIGDLILHGGMPYADGADNKGPLTFLLFAAVRLVSGTSVVMVRLTLLLFVVLTALALALLVGRYAGRAAAFTAGLLFSALASLAPWQGDDPNTEQYGVAFMTGAWALATLPSRAAAVGAGAALGGGIAVNALFGLVAPFVAYELVRSGGRRHLLHGLAGVIAVLVPIALWLIIGGATGDYAHQVFHDDLFSRSGGTGLLSHHAIHDVLDVPAGGMLLLGIGGALVAARNGVLRPLALSAIVWIALVWLKTEVQAYSFPHHWYVALPAVIVGLTLGVASVWPPDAAGRLALVALVLAFPFVTMVAGPQFRELRVPGHARWAVDSQTPEDWGLSYPVADFVRRSTRPGDRVFMVGANPEIYWLSRRRAPTRYFSYFIPLRDGDAARDRMADLERDPPAAIGAMVNGDAQADLPVLQPFIDAHGYKLAYELNGARVWLR